jgi:leucyl-tRNA synthetase
MNSSMETKWQKRWEDAGVFEAVPSEKPTFFVNVPYPYMNGFFHLGRSFTFLRADVIARFKRMEGYNTLFPFAFHCTGTPIVAAAQRVAEKEEKQIQILKEMGLPEEIILKFSDPIFWTDYFPEEGKKDLKRLGMGVDWRRTFKTTSLNPHYDKFVQWQFRKLKAMNLVDLGEHPVIWCTKCKSPVGDHARLEGEGETPQEFTLLKFRFNDSYLMAASLRPETVYGQTNMWVDPDLEYVTAKVNGETWIVSRPCAEKLSHQNKTVEILDTIKGEELLGKTCTAPGIDREILILPSGFCDPNKGTGLVTSVPSDAPDDWMGLYDLQEDPELCKKYGLDRENVRKVRPIAIITSKGWGDFPAVEICKKMHIENQYDREKLEKAKKEIYRSGFYTGKMNKNCGKYAGMKVEDAKDLIKQELIKEGKADIMYEPSGHVVCRCLTPSIVKIVKNQWFITYGNPAWKEKAHHAVEKMVYYPETVRKQFHYVVDWLNDWACTREFGLGTRLPWDQKWVIESLSDSTIYMAFYTFYHLLKDVDPEKITDEVFDYLLLGKGDPVSIAEKTGIFSDILRKSREEFDYWYPFDIRTSGKDLVQNHLTFCIFNHVALFPEEKWPLGFAVNGWVMMDMQKMSTSRGVSLLLREALDRYGADTTRITLMYSGEGIDDSNWDTQFADTIGSKLEAWQNFAVETYRTGRKDTKYIDRWFESVVHAILVEVTEAYRQMNFRTALQKGFFDMQRHLRWYLRRCDEPNNQVISDFIEIQTKVLAPIVPHMCEEIWEHLHKEGFISLAEWCFPNQEKIDHTVIQVEQFVEQVIDDLQEIVRVAKIENAQKAYLYTAEDWKWEVVNLVRDERDMKSAMQKAMQSELVRQHGKEAAKFIPKVIQERIFPQRINEEEILSEAKDFISREVGLEIEINLGQDPQNKKKAAFPGKPGIYIE